MNIALFDFDGTITFKDTFSLFIKQNVPKVRLIVGYLFLVPWIAGYKLGWIKGTQIRQKIVRIGFHGLDATEFQKKGEFFACEMIPKLVREKAFQRIQWHLMQGDKVVVVSASLDIYLAPWCRKNGLDLICSNLESDQGLLTGKYADQDCTGLEKKNRVLKAYNLKQYGKVYAYGDSVEDKELLELADVAYYRWKEIGAHSRI